MNDMALPKGKTCADCRNVNRCSNLFQVNCSNTECYFSPSRFITHELSWQDEIGAGDALAIFEMPETVQEAFALGWNKCRETVEK